MPKYHAMVFHYDDRIREIFEAVKARDGMPFHEQVRRAVVAWTDAYPEVPTGTRWRRETDALAARVDRLAEKLTREYTTSPSGSLSATADDE